MDPLQRSSGLKRGVEESDAAVEPVLVSSRPPSVSAVAARKAKERQYRVLGLLVELNRLFLDLRDDNHREVGRLY